MVKVPFNVIRVNTTPEGIEIIFPVGNNWFRCRWDKVPSRYKHLLYAFLKLKGYEIPDWLKEYAVNTLTIDDVDVVIDLDNCRQITNYYPAA